jgi:uncharacterized protein YecT (DUF1311 family)
MGLGHRYDHCQYCCCCDEGLMELARWNGEARQPLMRVAVLALCGAGLCGTVLAGCSSSGSPGGGGATSPAATATKTADTAAVAPFVSIVEPFDPGHPARVEPVPDTCGGQSTTLAIEKCYEANTENLDAEINAAQAAKYAKANPAGRAAILAEDSAWLAARGPVCRAAFTGGGTATGISVAACLFDESKARYISVEGIAPHEYRLKATDSMDPNALSWYTTPEGSRIAELSTQGDQTGGGIVTWTVIGGAQGFVVNPKQFFYMDSPFTDPGVVQPPDPTYHRVATGQEYQFSIDYSNLAKDPNKSGGYVYAPGDPAAEWN